MSLTLVICIIDNIETSKFTLISSESSKIDGIFTRG